MIDVRTRTDEVRAAGGFLRGVGSFLRGPSPLAGSSARLDRHLAAREATFAVMLDRGVFGQPASPYRQLLVWAGIEQGDITAMLRADGVAATLERLYTAGVRVTLEEFKGRTPIRRGRHELAVTAADFDNPLSARDYEAQTGGSSGTARPILVDLDLLEHEAIYQGRLLSSAGVAGRPIGIWHLAPPGAVGIKTALIQARLGHQVVRWFSQSRPADAAWKHGVFARATILAAAAAGTRIPAPAWVPPAQAARVARWLAATCRAGAPAVLATTASGAVRACTAALDEGLDIAGTFFSIVGEPYTRAKAAVVALAGCRAVSNYAMAEAGLLGVACLDAVTPDDVHLLLDKIATIQRDTAVGTTGTMAPALHHTTLLPATPKLMINVESGDYAVRTTRTCTCGVLPAGYTDHVHTIRSYEKLTSEGMHFLGDDLLALVEDRLPARFGGGPTDYQLAEDDASGLARVTLLVRPSIGRLDEAAIVRDILDFLRSRGQSQALMASVWEQSGTLRIVRADPRGTAGGKIPPLTTIAD